MNDILIARVILVFVFMVLPVITAVTIVYYVRHKTGYTDELKKLLKGEE
jgi:hypothetical protein